ncbi:unnamed protein product [Closterium sp. NIES-54]
MPDPVVISSSLLVDAVELAEFDRLYLSKEIALPLSCRRSEYNPVRCRRCRAALKLAFLAANPPPMYITLYYLVTHLPDSLHAVRDHSQKLREWMLQHGSTGANVRCPYIRRTGRRTGEPCGKTGHTEYRCFCRLEDAWRTEYGYEQDIPNSVEGDCYSCVPRAAGIEAAALGACESAAAGTAYAEALHTFPLDSGASRCFFRDCTTVTPLIAHVSVSLADPSGGPVVAQASTVLPCPAVPSGSLSGLHIPSFSTNLVSNAILQDELVSTFTLGGQVVASAQVAASGQLVVSFSCRLLSHQNLLWHHHLGHPSLPRLRGIHSHLLVSGLSRSLPPLPRSLALPCLPCVEGRQRAAPHSSSFPPTTAPLRTLHMDVWGPAHVHGQDQERYFLLVVDNYTRYTTVFPLRSKVDACGVLIDWIIAVRRQLSARFQQDLQVL